MGSSLFWFDNWIGLGALYFVTPPDFYCDESIHNVIDVVTDGNWDEVWIRDLLPDDLAIHILEIIKPPTLHDEPDRAFWMLETIEEFYVKSSWNYLRRRKDHSIVYKNMWEEGLTFKISFFMWKLWKGKLPLDETIRRWGYFVPSRCWCCANPLRKHGSMCFSNRMLLQEFGHTSFLLLAYHWRD
ncbi:uncharacterized protein LOC142163913 [Nicotiana tabacum]|uniref:Uncharacterized protein LOC142163913 n=1 Tax=Nicotiana tabacum TaxID=4097 RepID=A0AC58RWP3_TOBAC